MAFDKLVDSAKLEMEMTATAVAIRNKTGLTDTIPWEDNTGFANAVAAITVGGGSSEDVRYVTFFNEDGTIEYGKKAVATGDDCADPIARGVFDTPAKESTAQYNFTFGGWATTPNGGIDANALKAVNEDRIVYANFISAVRYYTVSFYDGETLLTSKQVAYGSSTEYSPDAKEGYFFDKWEPVPENITGDMNCYAQWKLDVDFADATWAEIAAISERGEAAIYFALGDEKTISYNGKSVKVSIIAFDHDNLADGSGKAGITIGVKSLLSPKIAWQTGLYQNVLHPHLNSTVLGYLPSDLQNVIKSVTKKVDTEGKNEKIGTISAKLWAFARDELITTDWANGYSSNLGEMYDRAVYNETMFMTSDSVGFHLRTLSRNPAGVIRPYYLTRSGGAIREGYDASSIERFVVFGFCI